MTTDGYHILLVFLAGLATVLSAKLWSQRQDLKNTKKDSKYWFDIAQHLWSEMTNPACSTYPLGAERIVQLEEGKTYSHGYGHYVAPKAYILERWGWEENFFTPDGSLYGTTRINDEPELGWHSIKFFENKREADEYIKARRKSRDLEVEGPVYYWFSSDEG